MPFKMTVEFVCANCKKKIKLKGTVRRHASHRRGYYKVAYFPSLYEVLVNEWHDFSTKSPVEAVSVTKGARLDEDDDGRGVCCGLTCATKLVVKLVGKLEVDKDMREEIADKDEE